jgi:hypothetical protein
MEHTVVHLNEDHIDSKLNYCTKNTCTQTGIVEYERNNTWPYCNFGLAVVRIELSVDWLKISLIYDSDNIVQLFMSLFTQQVCVLWHKVRISSH